MKKLMRALAGETMEIPPAWMMRQAGRYLPEYRATRGQAGDFLSLCYNSELAAEVTLQPIRRFGFDAAIVFADILLIAQALGSELWFETGEGPRLSTTTSLAEVEALRPCNDIHETLAPIYQTLRLLSAALPSETALIGFAGAPFTVASYMIAGRGVPGQAPALKLLDEDEPAFAALIDTLTEATVLYLSAQVEAGAEVVKLFDSWAGSLPGDAFDRYCLAPAARIVTALKARHPGLPVILFPRGAGPRYTGTHRATGADCIAVDNAVAPEWAAANVQRGGCVQGNLAPNHMVTGGAALVRETRRVKAAFSGGPHIFNLGHGITPDADPDNVTLMLDTLRQTA